MRMLLLTFFLFVSTAISQEFIRLSDKAFIQNGKEFYSTGVNCINIKEGPPKIDGDKIYDMSSMGEKKWTQLVKKYFDYLGFNTVGPFSSHFLQKDFKHCVSIYFGNYKAPHMLLDVFDPSYDKILDEIAKKECLPRREDKNLVGFFIGNEASWYGAAPWIPHHFPLLEQFKNLPENSPGCLKVKEFLKETQNSNYSYDKLCDQWAGIVAAEYMRKCRNAIFKYDPNHLILGCRFAALPADEIVKGVAQYSDVLSFNLYNNDFSMLDHYNKITNRKIMITEFSWRAMENLSNNPNTHGPWCTVQTQQDRANNYIEYLNKIIKRKYIIGIQFFQWADESPGGRNKAEGDRAENSNYGIFSTSGQLYVELAAAMNQMNKKWQKKLLTK